MQRPQVPINCFFQGCYNPQFEKEIKKCKDICWQYNKLILMIESLKTRYCKNFSVLWAKRL